MNAHPLRRAPVLLRVLGVEEDELLPASSDLDEGEGWEMLDGELGQISFAIPLADVASVEPLRDETLVVLTSGETLTLAGTHDVSDDNSGVLVFEGGEEPTYVTWSDIERIDFNR